MRDKKEKAGERRTDNRGGNRCYNGHDDCFFDFGYCSGSISAG